MPEPPRDQGELVARFDQRCERLESRYAHLDRVVETLNEVVIEQGKRIDQLERQLATLTHQLSSLVESGPELRSMEEDKPPHY